MQALPESCFWWELVKIIIRVADFAWVWPLMRVGFWWELVKVGVAGFACIWLLIRVSFWWELVKVGVAGFAWAWILIRVSFWWELVKVGVAGFAWVWLLMRVGNSVLILEGTHLVRKNLAAWSSYWSCSPGCYRFWFTQPGWHLFCNGPRANQRTMSKSACLRSFNIIWRIHWKAFQKMKAIQVHTSWVAASQQWTNSKLVCLVIL